MTPCQRVGSERRSWHKPVEAEHSFRMSPLAKCAGAVRGQRATIAIGFAGMADTPAVPDDLMGEKNPAWARDDFHEVALDVLGS